MWHYQRYEHIRTHIKYQHTFFTGSYVSRTYSKHFKEGATQWLKTVMENGAEGRSETAAAQVGAELTSCHEQTHIHTCVEHGYSCDSTAWATSKQQTRERHRIDKAGKPRELQTLSLPEGLASATVHIPHLPKSHESIREPWPPARSPRPIPDLTYRLTPFQHEQRELAGSTGHYFLHLASHLEPFRLGGPGPWKA